MNQACRRAKCYLRHQVFKMVKSLCLFVFLHVSFLLCAQNFEGKIIYEINIKSKLPNVTSRQFTEMLGTTQVYYVKGSHYKSVTNGAVLQWQIYVPSENRLYNKLSNSDTIFWNDGAVNKDSVLNIQLLQNADTILSYTCDKLILHCVAGIQEYEFNEAVAKVDPAVFVQHKLSNWYEVMKKTHALPLQYKLDNPQFTLTATAVSITTMKLDLSLFLLPANAKTEKSNY